MAAVTEAVTIIEQEQGDSSNFLEKGIDFLIGVFGGSSEKVDTNVDKNGTIQSLAFANLVDSVLINYGNAYAVDFDMTNMSNMVTMGNNSSSMTMNGMIDDNNNDNSNSNRSMNMDSMDMSSSTMMNMDSNSRNYSLEDIIDYQSAQALTTKAQEIFNTELKPIRTRKFFSLCY